VTLIGEEMRVYRSAARITKDIKPIYLFFDYSNSLYKNQFQ